ncbi:hypothetical protein GX656_02415 [Candidatus Dojkabacteria bacterium]|uniref:Uncharacterized protein n=1 Tax=Candidatus Dojkabacteria bacterium TaxID=2099670 RepID=A0A847D1Z6_9BACT|nr:hypothetical protein [Candidatus Dojkabacteria bacterium]
MEDIFLKKEQEETPNRMVEIFDSLVTDVTTLNNSQASSDIESTKELAVVKLIDSDDTTQAIISALKGSEYEQKIQEIFPKRNIIQTIVQRREKNPSISKRLILLPELNKSQADDKAENFTLILLDKENDLPFQIIGEQKLSLKENVKESCQKVVNLEKAQLQEITDKLVKNSF